MSGTRLQHYLSFLRHHRWGAVVSGLGILFGIIEFVHIRAMSTSFGIILEALLPFLGAVGLTMAGYALWTQRYNFDDSDVPRVVGWTIVGMGGMGLVFLWILSHQLIRGGTFHHPHFILVNNLIAGGLIGFVIGTYDARSQTHQRSIEQERLKHDFLNRELRHHLLNGMNIIQGQVERLDQEVDTAHSEAITTIDQRGEEMVKRIESVRMIAQAFTEDGAIALNERDLSTALTDVIEQVDERYAGALLSTDIPDGIRVDADQFLHTIFENLLTNAIEHNDEDSPHVDISLTVDEETAVVRIADNGPGMPDTQRTALFTWEEPTGGSIGKGVGLAIVNVLVDRYRGRVWVEENTPKGAVVYVALPRAT